MKERGAHIIWSCLVEQGVDTSDKTAARIVALLGRQVGVLAVEDWTSMASPLEE